MVNGASAYITFSSAHSTLEDRDRMSPPQPRLQITDWLAGPVWYVVLLTTFVPETGP